MHNNINAKNVEKLKKALLIIAIASLLAYMVVAGTVTWDELPPPAINCTQNQLCVYDFNATSSASLPLNYSLDKPPFSQNIDQSTGILNFTPTNDDVDEYDVFAIAAELGGPGYEVSRINWTILNVNDPPYIISYYLEELTNNTVKEGYWQNFNVTAHDLDIQFGDSLNYTWLVNGTINRTLLNYTDNIANFTPDYFSQGFYNITVNVSDNDNASVFINWTINVTNENRAPINNDTISNVTMLEDTSNYSIFNLSNYFYDLDIDDYPLSYSTIFVVGNDLTVVINATEPNNVSIIPDTNFFGINIIQLRCFDGYNYTFSNNVTVNVTGVNDAPIVTQVPDQTAYADVLYQLQIPATDPDNTPPDSGLTYYDNTTLFNINPSTGLISDTFSTSEIGNYTILINVSDGQVNTSMIFNLSVINNTAPVIGGKPLPDMYTTEDNYTRIDFNATDADTQDTLNFSIRSSPYNAKFNLVVTDHSPLLAEAYMDFTPDQTDVAVGTFTLTINASDNKGAFDTDTLLINVANIEHTPVLAAIADQRMKVNLTFSLNITATDDDGNIQAFGENTSLFNITLGGSGYNAEGFINFTPNDTQVGEHWVNITINDSAGRHDWQVVLFNVTYNTVPVLQPIPDQNAIEDALFTYQVDATDDDPQDTLIYYDNSTILNISNTTGLISFTPTINHTGEHIINITVTDGEANVSTLMNLTIGSYNDFPYWDPPLDEYYINESLYLNTTHWNSSNILDSSTNMTVWNSTILQNNYTHILLDAFDEEYGTTEFGPEFTLSFSRAFVNYTNASNDTVTSGITLFDITNHDGDTARINFTANNSQVGVYYVNLTVDDTTGRTNTTTIRLEVFNVNDAPIIINYSPNTTYYLNMTENSSMMFNVTAIDIDYNDSLRYQWAINGTNITGANDSYYDYYADFLSAGWRNLTVFVLDDANESTMLNWTINITNLNRIGWFGQIRQSTYTHFNAGLTKINVTILPGDEGVILYNPGTGYRKTGEFESAILDTTETNYFHTYSTINWSGNTTPPADVSFSFYFQTRTAEGFTPTTCPSSISANYSDAHNTSNSPITSDDERCVQYKFIISTNDSDYTPSISNVIIGYEIANRIQEQSTNQSWVDLDTYFFEPDSDDERTFTVTAPDNSTITDVNISIEPTTRKVYVATNDAFVGDLELMFHMDDGYNITNSNIIRLTITEAESFPEVIIVPLGGGGGAVSQPVPYEVPKYVTAPISFRLLVPQAVTTYVNDTMEIPINIFNSNFTMDNLRLKASTPNEDVVISLSRDYILRLEPNQKEFLTLFVESYKTYGTYEIILEATAEATSVAEDGTEKKSEFNEKAKIFVNSLLKAEGNESQVNTKLAFAEDLLSTNPECLELNEFLKKTRQLIADEQLNKADTMLDQVVESCKYLIAPKELKPEVEEPTKVYGMPTESLFILGTVAIVTLLVAIALVIGWAHLKTKRREAARKKGENL
jgi:hypothetical protein